MTIKMLRQAGIPVVALATALPSRDVSAVRINDHLGAFSMTRHLLSLGHTRIAFISGDPDHTPSGSRYEGFVASMTEA